MFRRFTQRPPMVPENLSDYVQYQSYQVFSIFKSNWLAPLHKFLAVKNLVDIRLNNLREQVELYRPTGNKKWIAAATIVYCREMKKRLLLWDIHRQATLNALAECRDFPQCVQLEKMINTYIPRALAKIYIFTITALFAFDKRRLNLTPQLYHIYDNDESFDQLADIFESCQECLYDWKKQNKYDPMLVQEVSDFIAYLEERLQIKPLKKVRFNI